MPAREAPSLHRVLAASLLVAAALAPVASALCAPACDVATTPIALPAYAPPATVVLSGSTVTWTTLDDPHTATSKADMCMNAFYSEGSPGSATLSIVGGKLLATVGTTTKTCTSATALPDGSLVLAYTCLYHPNMKAELVVK